MSDDIALLPTLWCDFPSYTIGRIDLGDGDAYLFLRNHKIEIGSYFALTDDHFIVTAKLCKVGVRYYAEVDWSTRRDAVVG